MGGKGGDRPPRTKQFFFNTWCETTQDGGGTGGRSPSCLHHISITTDRPEVLYILYTLVHGRSSRVGRIDPVALSRFCFYSHGAKLAFDLFLSLRRDIFGGQGYLLSVQSNTKDPPLRRLRGGGCLACG